MIKDLLHTCGLNESEQKVFICLLSHGASIASVISKRTRLKRTTVYAVLQNLFQIGIISKQTRENVTYFGTVSPELIPQTLRNYAKRNYEEVAYASKALRPHLKEIAKKESYEISGFEVRSIESPEALYIQLENTLISGDFHGIFNPHKAFYTNPQKEIGKRFLEKTAITQPLIKEIIVSGPEAEWYKNNIQNPNHKIKEVDKEKKVLSDMIFIHNAVYLFHYTPQEEVGIKITHKDYYISMMTLWEMLWEQL